MAGYICQLCDGAEPAVQLHTSLETGATIALCAACLPVGLAGALATVLGVDPVALYDAVTGLLAGQDQDGQEDQATQATGQEPVVTQTCPYCDQVIRGTRADIDSGLRKHIEYCEMAPQEES